MLLVLLGAALHATWNVIIKAGSDKQLDTMLVICGGAILAGFALPFLPLPEKASWPYLGASWRSGRFPLHSTVSGLLNAVVIMAYTLVDGLGIRASGNASSYILWLFFLIPLASSFADPFDPSQGIPGPISFALEGRFSWRGVYGE